MPPPMPGGGAQYPAPGGPALGFDSYTSPPPMGIPGVSIRFDTCTNQPPMV